MAKYAEKTTVSSEDSRREIERTLVRYGATAFMYGWEGPKAVIQFRAKDRYVRFTLPLPDLQSKEFTHTPERGWARSTDQTAKAYEGAVRQRWRALALVIKAKLEAVDAGIVEFEDEFLAHVVLPDGQTVSGWLRPQVALAYDRCEMPLMLPGPTPPRAEAGKGET